MTIPRELGPVRLLREIGRGGMGVVYLGRHQMLDRDVAVKFLLNATAGPDDPGFAGFLEGARAAARLEHPGLTTIHHADVVDGVPYLVMQYVDGPALSDVLKRTGPLSLSASFAVLDAVSEAIGELHDRGIIHRDIKPGNVLLGLDGRIVVTDFGLSLARPMGQRGPSSARLGGTPVYMAPEMFTGEVSLRSDVYALGIMTFELVTGELPFAGTLEEVREKNLHEPLPLEPLQRRRLDPAMIEVLERATRKNAMFRYKSAQHFRSALKSGIMTDELLREGVADLQRLVSRTLDSRPHATTTEATGTTPTSTYFDRLAEIAEAKRATREPPHEAPLERPAREDRAEAPLLSPDDEPVEAGSIPGPPSAEPTPASRSASAAALVVDVPCVKCEYNLRGLSASGQCPECGEPVASSLRPDRLLFANPKWLSTIALGQTLIFATMIAMPVLSIVALVVASLLRATGLEFLHVMRLLMLAEVAIAGGGIATGVFLSTRREPALAAPKRTTATRWIARVCALVGIPGIFAGATFSTSTGGVSTSSTTLIPLGEFVQPIGLAACVIGCVSLLLYLRKLAERVPDAKLLRSTRQLTTLLYALVPLALGCVALRWTVLASTARPESRLMFGANLAIVIVPTVLTVAAGGLYWFLMVAYRRSIKRAIAVAVSYDTLFGEAPTQEALASDPRSKPDPQATANPPDEVLCIRCGYNLRGLVSDGQCPECGTPIDRSRGGNLLAAADSAWLAGLCRGLTLVVAAVVVHFVGLFLKNAGSWVNVGLADLAAPIEAVRRGVSAALLLLGVVLITRLDPRLALAEHPVVLRTVTRGMATAGLLLYILALLLTPITPSVLLAGGIKWCVRALLIATIVSASLYLARLAKRIPDEELASSTRSTAIRFAVAFPMFMVSRAIAEGVLHPGLAYVIVRLFFALLAVCSVLFACAYSFTLVGLWTGTYRKAFRKCLAEAEDRDRALAERSVR